MSSELMMDSGISGKTKLMILGGVVVVFALTIGILTHGGKPVAKTKPGVAQSAQVVPAAPAAPDAMPAAQSTQMASKEITPQTAAPVPSDATGKRAIAAMGAVPGTPTQVAASEPAAPATLSPSAERQDTSAWSQASLDDGSIDASRQEVATQAPVSQPRPAVRPPPSPAIDALQPWWRDPAKPQGFDVQYVGQAASEKALVFRFSKNIADAQKAAQHIHVTDDRGDAAAGVWLAGNNPYILVYQGVSAGRYMVSIDAALASANGSTLGSALRGAVYVN